MVDALTDGFGRQVHDLRISVTDRCNFRCTYCMPHEDMQWLPRDEILTFEEIDRVARVFVERFGISSVRVTGGEPTVRAHLPTLVGFLARLPVELSMTTNGATLDRLAAPLKTAGLHRVTVSCDSLRRDRFASITGRDMLPQVLAGLDAAVEAGLSPVKVNCVLVRGVNDDEVLDLAEFGRDRGVEVRFIEFMPLDGDGQWALDRVVPASEVVERIDAVHPLEPGEASGGAGPGRGPEPADRYRYADGAGHVGVVASVTRPFCSNCDRVRLTAEGSLRSCLFAVRERDLRAILRGGGTDDDLAEAIVAEVATKWAGHAIGKVNFVRPSRSMSQIGG
ncbi:MAG TPA: GTP 3',8-cyclase MoaA [Acidimicrobiales bacterium]|nr:GTP 3',8-cyclase MoaA [Acidimicrobiales bacterium]